MSGTDRQRRDTPPEDPPSVLQSETAALPVFEAGDTQEGGVSSRVEGVRERHEAFLMTIDGVEGVTVGPDEIGDDVIVVFVRDSQVRERVPPSIEGVRVKTEVTGEFDAFDE